MQAEVHRLYGKNLRIRACGLCVSDDRVLMVNHRGLSEGNFWAPPGGAVQFLESAPVALAREFLEETGLHVRVDDFLFTCEFIEAPLHAIELYFRVSPIGGALTRGEDPEMNDREQIIQSVRWMSWEEIGKTPLTDLHGMFKKVPKPARILDLRGYLIL